MTPFFSIITPTYNSEETIESYVESIINQTYSNYEIVIIDGVSEDKTVEILYSYKNEKINVLSERDNGIYEAMNKGIVAAKGEWLLFLGSDDKLFNEHVLKEVALILEAENQLEVLYGNVFSSRFKGIYDGEFDDNKIYVKNICHQAIFFKRLVFELIGNYDVRFKSYSDYHHNLKWFLNVRIRRKYVNLMISTFADGGYSSTHNDLLFLKEKNMHYLVCSSAKSKKSNVKLKRIIWFSEAKKAITEINVMNILKLITQIHKLFLF